MTYAGAETAHEFGNLLPAEEEKHDECDDEDFAHAKTSDEKWGKHDVGYGNIGGTLAYFLAAVSRMSVFSDSAYWSMRRSSAGMSMRCGQWLAHSPQSMQWSACRNRGTERS